MAYLSGRRLSVLGAALIALAGAAALRTVVSGGLVAAVLGAAAKAGPPAGGGTPGAAALPAAGHVALALSAERRGSVAEALAHYRAAVAADPRCVDSRSPAFLGDAFGPKLKGWIDGLESGRIAAGSQAVEDASFLFRRLYGGCG